MNESEGGVGAEPISATAEATATSVAAVVVSASAVASAVRSAPLPDATTVPDSAPPRRTGHPLFVLPLNRSGAPPPTLFERESVLGKRGYSQTQPVTGYSQTQSVHYEDVGGVDEEEEDNTAVNDETHAIRGTKRCQYCGEDGNSLRQQLQSANDELQKTREDLQAARYDLRDTRDDLRATRDELQFVRTELRKARDSPSAGVGLSGPGSLSGALPRGIAAQRGHRTPDPGTHHLRSLIRSRLFVSRVSS